MNLKDLQGAQLDQYAAAWEIGRRPRLLFFRESDRALRARILRNLKERGK